MSFKKLIKGSLAVGLALVLCLPLLVKEPMRAEAEETSMDAPADTNVSESADTNTSEPAEAPAQEPADAPTDTNAQEPAETPADTNAQEPAAAPTDTNAQETIVAPTDTNTQEPIEAPIDVDTTKPAEPSSDSETPAISGEMTDADVVVSEEEDNAQEPLEVQATSEVLNALSTPNASDLSEAPEVPASVAMLSDEIAIAEEEGEGSEGEEEEELEDFTVAPSPAKGEVEMTTTITSENGTEVKPAEVKQGSTVRVNIQPKDKDGNPRFLGFDAIVKICNGGLGYNQNLLYNKDDIHESYTIELDIEEVCYDYPYIIIGYYVMDGEERTWVEEKIELKSDNISLTPKPDYGNCDDPNSPSDSSAPSSDNGSSSASSDGASESPETGAADVTEEIIVPANTVTISGGRQLQSTIEGNYILKSMSGVAITTPKMNVAAAAGLSEADIAKGTNVKFYVCDSRNREMKTALREIASASGKKVVAYIQADLYTITKQGVISNVRSTSTPIEMVFGVPESLARTEKDYSIICIDENGKVVTFEDLDTNSATITINANVFGVYAIVY